MTIAILETGEAPGDLPQKFGRYDEMFRRLLGAGFDYRTFQVFDGELPEDPAAFEAVLITGSPAGVYDPLPWIAPLEAFIRAAAGKTRMVGVCFGHQVMASALGGKVIKSPKGWGVGQHVYQIAQRRPWMDEAQTITMPVSHQDQVVEPPPGATVVGGSDFTPFGLLEYEALGAISMQCHPEFERPFVRALIERRQERIPEELSRTALASLEQPNDNARVGGWITRFLRG